MRLLIELSGESEELARAEAVAVALSEGTFYDIVDSDGRALVTETDADPLGISKRLALAWSVCRHGFSCLPDELGSHSAELDLPGKTYRINVRKMGEDKGTGTKQLVSQLAETISSGHKVDLENPDAEIRVLVTDRCHIGILLHEIDRTAFESRKSDNRPFSHPISLHPRLARALVNLTGAREGDKILDPFCGTGGILIEAAMMGLDPVGSDIDDRMLQGTKTNLAHLGLPGVDLYKADISDIGDSIRKVRAIATDPPYGRSASTAKEPIDELYGRAFSAFAQILEPGGTLAIVLPSEEHATLGDDYFKLTGHYPVRVHKSLTRHVCVFRPF